MSSRLNFHPSTFFSAKKMDAQTWCISSSLSFFIKIFGISLLFQLLQFALLLAQSLPFFKQLKAASPLFYASHRPPRQLNTPPLAEHRRIVFSFVFVEGLLFHGVSRFHSGLLEAWFVWWKQLWKLRHADRCHVFELCEDDSVRSCVPIFIVSAGTWFTFARSRYLQAMIKQTGWWRGRHNYSF